MNFITPNYQISWFESKYDKELHDYLSSQLRSLIKKDSKYQLFFHINTDDRWVVFLFINPIMKKKVFQFNIECSIFYGKPEQSILNKEEIKELIELSYPYSLIDDLVHDSSKMMYFVSIFQRELETNSFRLF
ncbi:MAG: hypothetical protein HeimC3_08190 [Candidatus Heimdallarchaeota archaeon LC_3]|nr:MAG: hypothetical protein HeimC3_08190 [Candidatus Heimdallarchaeota archaeon LC_3]